MPTDPRPIDQIVLEYKRDVACLDTYLRLKNENPFLAGRFQEQNAASIYRAANLRDGGSCLLPGRAVPVRRPI